MKIKLSINCPTCGQAVPFLGSLNAIFFSGPLPPAITCPKCQRIFILKFNSKLFLFFAYILYSPPLLLSQYLIPALSIPPLKEIGPAKGLPLVTFVILVVILGWLLVYWFLVINFVKAHAVEPGWDKITQPPLRPIAIKKTFWSIYCPNCDRKLTQSQINFSKPPLTVICRKCRTEIIFEGSTVKLIFSTIPVLVIVGVGSAFLTASLIGSWKLSSYIHFFVISLGINPAMWLLMIHGRKVIDVKKVYPEAKK